MIFNDNHVCRLVKEISLNLGLRVMRNMTRKCTEKQLAEWKVARMFGLELNYVRLLRNITEIEWMMQMYTIYSYYIMLLVSLDCCYIMLLVSLDCCYIMLFVSLDCPFLVASSCFSYIIYFNSTEKSNVTSIALIGCIFFPLFFIIIAFKHIWTRIDFVAVIVW